MIKLIKHGVRTKNYHVTRKKKFHKLASRKDIYHEILRKDNYCEVLRDFKYKIVGEENYCIREGYSY